MLELAAIGDLDGDGVTELAVGANRDDDGGPDTGAIYIAFLNSGGTANSVQKISATAGNFGGALDDGDLFATSVGPLGDIDGDGTVDLITSSRSDDDGDDETASHEEGLFVGVFFFGIVKDDVVGEHGAEAEELGVERGHDGREDAGGDESDDEGISDELGNHD